MKPTSKETYRRLMILKYLISHAYHNLSSEYLDSCTEDWTIPERESFDKEMENNMLETISSIKSFGLWNYTTESEKDFLSSSGSQMNNIAQMNATWRMEAAAVLMWALNLVDKFPILDEQVNTELLNLIEIKKTDYSLKFCQ